MACEVYLGNALDADGTEGQVIITDPPYSAHVHKSAVSQSAGRGVRVRDLGFDHLSEELRRHVATLIARTPRWSVIYSDIESLADWRLDAQRAGATYIRAIPWVRWSMPQLSGDRPPSGCEMLSVFWGSQEGRKSWHGPGNLTHLDHKCLRGEDKHKAEKPLDQCLDLVEFFSEPGDTVLDPFAGSGTIGLACAYLGRNYVGIELDPVWVERANARLHGVILSERDHERVERWHAAKHLRDQEKERIALNTSKVRARLDAKKGAA